MKKPDFLTDIIRSLSKPEKRYFKLFAARYKQDEEKNYIRLFNAFEKLRSDSPARATGKLKEEDYSGRLAYDKHYLSEILLASLRQYHAESTIQLELGTELLSVELLRGKGLHAHALKKVQRVKKEAEKYELLEVLLHAISLEKEIRFTGSIGWPELAPAIFEETEHVLEKIRVMNRLDSQRVELLLMAKEKGRPASENEMEEWNRRLETFSDDVNLTGLAGETSMRQRLQAYARFVMRDSSGADKVNAKRYGFFRAHPEQVEKAPLEYVLFLFTYCWTSTQVGNYAQAEILLNDLRGLREKYAGNVSPAMCREIDNRLLPTEIYLYGKTAQYDRIVALEPEAEKFYRHIAPGLEGSFIFNMATTFLIAGDFRRVISWTHRANSTGVLRKDYVTYTINRIMQIIAHLSLGDHEVATSLANATQRYVLQRKDAGGGIDASFIALLKKCAATDEHHEQRRYAAEFLEVHAGDKVFAGAEEYYPLRCWVKKLAGEAKTPPAALVATLTTG